jgi:two-component system sensor histidine kinase DegS
MQNKSTKPRQEFMYKYHFGLIVLLFIIITILHYPNQFHFWAPLETSSWLPWITRHTLDRVLLLVPITYANFIFGLRAGIISTILSLFIMLPRALFLSDYTVDSLFEIVGVTVVATIMNYWFYINNLNITQRKRAEEMLSKIVDGTTIPTFVIDKNHKVTHWNTAIESLTGITRKEIIGTSDQWRSFHKAKTPVLADLLVDGVSEEDIKAKYGQSCHRSPLIEGAYEAERLFPDLGKEGKWLDFTASPITNGQGGIIGAIETLIDVSERKDAEENLKFYLKEITKAQEEERKRIARELHDETAQNLIALLHQLENLLNSKEQLPLKEAQSLWKFYEQIRDVLQEVRHFSRDLRPSILDDLGLLPALEWLAEDLKTNYWVETSLQVIGKERRLSPEAELLLFRIVQESLRNVAKHAKADHASVKVEFADNKIMIIVTDDGIGFALPANLAALPHIGKLGLTGLQERVQLLGGELNIKSELNKGTTIFVEAPIEKF